MFNIKLTIYPTIVLLSMVTLPILFFIKKQFFTKYIKEKKEPYLSPEEKYIKKNRGFFDKTYQSSSHIEKFNENMDSIFFNKDLYSETTKLPDSELELSWRRRILFEFTPRGNVIMFYDSYKQGFSYYSDQSISYNLLNAIAMKYVIVYRCRDFFIDENIIPESFPSTLLTVQKQEELQKLTVTDNKKKLANIDTKTGPFAKFQSYSKSSNPVTSSIINKKLNLPNFDNSKSMGNFHKKDVIKNKFIHLGKLINWDILKQYSKKNKNLNSKSKLEIDLEKNSDVQLSTFSYKNFKLNKSTLNA
jgi:hypothetical protein